MKAFKITLLALTFGLMSFTTSKTIVIPCTEIGCNFSCKLES